MIQSIPVNLQTEKVAEGSEYLKNRKFLGLYSFWCQLSPQLAENKCVETVSHRTASHGGRNQYILNRDFIEYVHFLCFSTIIYAHNLLKEAL